MEEGTVPRNTPPQNPPNLSDVDSQGRAPSNVWVCLQPIELEALYSLPARCLVLYIAIRRAMDGRTGLVGELRRISWWMLRESLYIEPAPNRRVSGTPDESTTRRLAYLLRSAGLLVFMGSSNDRELKFKCPLAPVRKLVPKKSDTIPTGYSDTPLRPGNGLESDTPKTGYSDRHLESILSIGSSSTPKVVARANTAPGTSGENPAGQMLKFNGLLSAHQQRAIRDKLLKTGCGVNHAQRIVDELHGRIRAAKGTDQAIKNPVSYVTRIIDSAAAPDWQPRYADDVAAERDDLSRRLPTIPTTSTEPRGDGPSRPGKAQWSGLPLTILKKMRKHDS